MFISGLLFIYMCFRDKEDSIVEVMLRYTSYRDRNKPQANSSPSVMRGYFGGTDYDE